MRTTSSPESESKRVQEVIGSEAHRDRAFGPAFRLVSSASSCETHGRAPGTPDFRQAFVEQIENRSNFQQVQSRCHGPQQWNGRGHLSSLFSPRQAFARASTRELASLASSAPSALGASREQDCQRIGQHQRFNDKEPQSFFSEWRLPAYHPFREGPACLSAKTSKII